MAQDVSHEFALQLDGIDGIAAGVERMIDTSTDSTLISTEHARLSDDFRRRFTRDVIATIFRETGNQTAPESVIETSFRHKMAEFVTEKQAAAIIQGLA